MLPFEMINLSIADGARKPKAERFGGEIGPAKGCSRDFGGIKGKWSAWEDRDKERGMGSPPR